MAGVIAAAAAVRHAPDVRTIDRQVI